MWKKSSIFFLVLVFAVSSAFSYPAWMYGKEKTEESPLLTEQMQSELPEVEENTEQEELKIPSRQEKTLPVEESKESLKELKASAVESIEDEAILAAISEYVEVVNDGITVMTNAYKEEVAYSKGLENKYNALADAYADDVGKAYKPHSFLDDFSITVNPFATYAIKTQTWGIGGQVGIGWKDITLTVGAINPAVKAVGDLIKTDDIMVTAGIALTF